MGSDVVTRAKRAAPKVKRAAPKKAAPKVKRAAPKVKRAAPKVKRAAPKVKRAPPKVKRAPPKKVKRAAPKKVKHAAKKRAPKVAPIVAMPRSLRLERFSGGPAPELAVAAELVVTGAARADAEVKAMSAELLAVVSRWLDPVAIEVSNDGARAVWRFRSRLGVDPYSLLPALAFIAPELGAPPGCRLAWGALRDDGSYLPLAYTSAALSESAIEAVVLADSLRERYAKRPGAPADDDDESEEVEEAGPHHRVGVRA